MQAEPQETNNPLSLLLKILTCILCVMFPVGLFIMFSPWGNQFLWTTTLFLGMQAVITFLILIKLADFLSVALTAAVTLILSYLLEWWGVNTGFPFGYYSYTDVLKPLFNGVPLAISFAWFVVSVNSLLAAKYFLKNMPIITIICISAVFIFATDILLEPFASFVNKYWIWVDNRIPLQNFLGWLAGGFIFCLLIEKIIKWKKVYPENLMRVSLLMTGINLLNFTIVNAVYGYYVIIIIGIFIFTTVIFFSVKLRAQ